MNVIENSLRASLIFLLFPVFNYGQTLAQKPNVIVIMTDDQGSIDLNAYGANDLYTPNMDRLAREGVKFTQFYAGAPVCSPSRAALLTGKTNLRAAFLVTSLSLNVPKLLDNTDYQLRKSQ